MQNPSEVNGSENPVPYREMVKALAKPGQDIITQLTPAKAHLMHMAIGVAGEAGELLDAIKKHVIYNQQVNMDNVIEELGDIEFFLEGIRSELGIQREDVLLANRSKLGKRYAATKYSDQAAEVRADKTQS